MEFAEIEETELAEIDDDIDADLEHYALAEIDDEDESAPMKAPAPKKWPIITKERQGVIEGMWKKWMEDDKKEHLAV